jgi:hypothetical protein
MPPGTTWTLPRSLANGSYYEKMQTLATLAAPLTARGMFARSLPAPRGSHWRVPRRRLPSPLRPDLWAGFPGA